MLKGFNYNNNKKKSFMWENITIKGRQPTPINWRVILNLFILPLNAPLHYVFCLDLDMYDHRVSCYVKFMFLILLFDNKFVQFLCTGSSFFSYHDNT